MSGTGLDREAAMGDLHEFIELVGNGDFYADYDASCAALGKARRALAALRPEPVAHDFHVRLLMLGDGRFYDEQGGEWEMTQATFEARTKDCPCRHCVDRRSALVAHPDAFRVPFLDQTNDWQSAERIVPWPGHVGDIVGDDDDIAAAEGALAEFHEKGGGSLAEIEAELAQDASRADVLEEAARVVESFGGWSGFKDPNGDAARHALIEQIADAIRKLAGGGQ